MVSTGFSMESKTFGNVRPSFFNCIKRKEIQDSLTNIKISSTVLLRCRNKRPIKGLVRFVMTMNFSLNVMSLTSNCISTVAIGASNCPLANITWNSGGAPSFKFVCGASNRILRKSASGMAPDKALVSMSPSIVNSPESKGK